MVKESKNSFTAVIKSTTEIRIFKFLSLTLKDNLAPTNPPKKNRLLKIQIEENQDVPKYCETIIPDSDANSKINCEVGAALFIDIPIPTTIKGTKIIPPPFQKMKK